MYHTFLRKQITTFLLLPVTFLLFAGVAFAAPPGSTYSPGETLAPTCSPGSTNCTVSTTSPAGGDTNVQFNDGGLFGFDTTFSFNKTADRLTFAYASSTGITSAYASSTSLFAGSFTLGSLSGFLKATAGAVANALVNLASDVTGFLGVANGGTGTSTAFTAGSVIFAGTSGAYNQNNTNLFWDNTNSRLGIATTTPQEQLSVSGTIGATHVKGLGNTPSVSAGGAHVACLCDSRPVACGPARLPRSISPGPCHLRQTTVRHSSRALRRVPPASRGIPRAATPDTFSPQSR